MYYYFHSASPRAIFLSGAYLGTASETPKKCNVSSNNAFIEAVSLDNAGDDYRLILNSNSLENPPQGVIVTDLKGGYLLHFKDKPNNSEFKILAQEKYADAIITVFLENGLRLSIETERDFFATTIFENARDAQIKRLNDKRLILVSITLNKGVYIMIYDIKDKIRCVYNNQVSSFCLNETLSVITDFKDIKKHVLTEVLDYDGEKIITKSTTLTAKKSDGEIKILPEILPYLFLEDFMLGEDVSRYISCDILRKTDSLKEYLGEYIAVITPPLFRAQNEVGLIYKKSESTFFVEYYTFTIENDKIVNLNKLDE